MKKLLAALVLLCIAVPALAIDAPIVSLKRVSLAVGANYQWYGGLDEPTTRAFDKEFSGSLHGAYSMTPHLSLAAASFYGLDSKEFTSYVGVRIRIYRGSE